MCTVNTSEVTIADQKNCDHHGLLEQRSIKFCGGPTSENGSNMLNIMLLSMEKFSVTHYFCFISNKNYFGQPVTL